MNYWSLQLVILGLVSSLCAGEKPSEFQKKEQKLQNDANQERQILERRNFPCPVADDIAPCICTHEIVNEEGQLSLDCTDVASEEQLASVFQQVFPIKKFYRFTMNTSSVLTSLDFNCNGVNFEQIYIDPGPFSLMEIKDEFYYSCTSDKTDYVALRNTQLNYVAYPPAPLKDIISVFDMSESNKVSSIPKISAMNLDFFVLSFSEVSEIIPGTFDEIPKLHYLYLNNNKIRTLRNGSIPIPSNGYFYLLPFNEMETIEPGAFFLTGVPKTNDLSIHLYSNNLRTIDEAVFGSLMPYIERLVISGNYLNKQWIELPNELDYQNVQEDNPLDCYCDMAWIILEPEIFNKVNFYNPTCSDGTLLEELDPLIFQYYC